MANQSLISVPPNVDDPLVLRRFLARLVEQFDIIVGNRAGPTPVFVEQQQLLDTTNELILQLSEAKEALERAIAEAKLNIDSNLTSLNTIYGVVTTIEVT